MSFTDALKKAHQQAPQQAQPQVQPPQQPGQFAGPAPQTEEEVALIRQQMQAKEEEDRYNRSRVESLSATIFARMIGGPDIVDKCCEITQDGKININGKMLKQYLEVCNFISAEAAISHSNQVWGVACGRDPNQQPLQEAPNVPPQPSPAQ